MTIDTLPHWLRYQATHRPLAVAVRHKQLGIWREQRWNPLLSDVLRLVRGLKTHGFQPGDILFLLSYPRPEALLLSVAAQWLGGVAAPLDPDTDAGQQAQLLQALQPRFVFAEGQAQVDQLLVLGLQPHWLGYADARGLAAYRQPGLQHYDHLISLYHDHNEPLVLAQSHDDAFVFFRLDAQGHVEVQTLTHQLMLSEGRQLIHHEKLTANEEALAARGFAASGHVRYLLAPWLLAGFRLNFPENTATRDTDRRELGPTLVLGTQATYQRLQSLVSSRLPLPGTLRRYLVDWSLATADDAFVLRRLLAELLIRGPLRDVIGFTRTRLPLLAGEPLSGDTFRFFASLGITVRAWPDLGEWIAASVSASSPRIVLVPGSKPSGITLSAGVAA
ncbi:long-chain fatty acid--CoA ligase [Pseudomethylobacillus aquaticus]|uniref:Long-chain fatty acid--CoA ligase n=1 Tax=Pseudomethylobacillus aquaticus TaxID=2676064 RepID=A0A3N0UW67_9PROT|nr:AMP-binding protein [Pseudomethylobacillus aquaticus]ROH84471.1 long-chain fatty acid--CoA ligase [Pseudomethylobacillus aquaticus]